ncbi:MAG: BNR repeat-containing protein [Prolixibacteraceae bacterium]|nr:BNR repeat-containing protein [Prolixibacteraceae bacterium]
MKNIFTTILLIISLSVVAQTNNDQLVDYFTNNGLSNAVKTTQHPAGEYHEGITYVAYQGPEEDPYIASYNHIKGEWSGPFKAGESVLPGPNARPGKIDNHGKPAMIIDDEGYIHLVFGGHGGTKELAQLANFRIMLNKSGFLTV